MGNSVFDMHEHGEALRVHMQERVADYVAAGWCEVKEDKIMFMDGPSEPEARLTVSF